MKRTLLVASLMLSATFLATGQKTPESMLGAALHQEEVQGDLKGAIAAYQRVVATSGVSRKTAAEALVHMGQCYEKLGDAESRKAYERVLREYADQKDAAALARERLGQESGLRSSDTLARRLLCTDCGDYEANISMDGRLIAFTDYATGDVAIRDLSTGQVKRLMAKSGSYNDSVAYAEVPSFSPDLRQVAYIWQTGSGGRSLPTQLRLTANGPGAQTRVLLNSNPENLYYEPLGWTPDGKSILASVQKADRTWQFAWVSAADGALTTIKSLQWRLQVGWGIDPKLSPDGRYIAYAALAANPSKMPPLPTDPKDKHIYVLAADGSSETEVVKTSGVNLSPVWTPDGKHLLFLSDRSGTMALWSVALESGKAAGTPVLVSSNLGASSNFSAGIVWPMGVTRSGSYHYLLEQRGLEQISVADLRPGQRNTAESFAGVGPAWSPDGQFIAFKRPHPGTDGYDLIVHSLKTGEERTLQTSLGETGPGAPTWFHDGKSILVALLRGRAFIGSYQVDLETGEYKQLTGTTTAFGPNATLSLDDRTLYIFQTSGIVAVDLAAGTERKILATPEDGRTAFALSPDGGTLALWRSDFQARKTYIATVDVDGANFRELYKPDFVPYTTPSIPAWTRDGRAILFVERREGKRQIMRIAVQGGAPEFTGIEAEGDVQKIDVSPDGSRIAYSSTTKTRSELWALDNVVSRLK